jgi:hypothetical protein
MSNEDKATTEASLQPDIDDPDESSKIGAVLVVGGGIASMQASLGKNFEHWRCNVAVG